MHLQSYVGLLFFVYCGAAGNELQLLLFQHEPHDLMDLI